MFLSSTRHTLPYRNCWNWCWSHSLPLALNQDIAIPEVSSLIVYNLYFFHFLANFQNADERFLVSGRPGHLDTTWEVAVISSCSAFGSRTLNQSSTSRNPSSSSFRDRHICHNLSSPAAAAFTPEGPRRDSGAQ